MVQPPRAQTLRKKAFWAAASTVLLLFLSAFAADVRGETVQGWQAVNEGGYYSESDGVIRLWSTNPDRTGGYNLYKEIAPDADFTFSLQVKAASLGNWLQDVNKEGFGIALSQVPYFNATKCLTFEFRGRDGGFFVVARNTRASPSWTTTTFVYNRPVPNGNVVGTNVWYTMRLRVQKTPFAVTAEVSTENGTLLGTCQVADIADITFQNIRYIGLLAAWGGDFTIRNISVLPVASRFSYSPSEAIVYMPVIFNGTTSLTPNGPIVTYSWYFGDNYAAEGLLPVVTHSYQSAGVYMVRLTITDSLGVSAFSSQPVRVRNPTPVSSPTFATPLPPTAAYRPTTTPKVTPELTTPPPPETATFTPTVTSPTPEPPKEPAPSSSPTELPMTTPEYFDAQPKFENVWAYGVGIAALVAVVVLVSVLLFRLNPQLGRKPGQFQATNDSVSASRLSVSGFS